MIELNYTYEGNEQTLSCESKEKLTDIIVANIPTDWTYDIDSINITGPDNAIIRQNGDTSNNITVTIEHTDKELIGLLYSNEQTSQSYHWKVTPMTELYLNSKLSSQPDNQSWSINDIDDDFSTFMEQCYDNDYIDANNFIYQNDITLLSEVETMKDKLYATAKNYLIQNNVTNINLFTVDNASYLYIQNDTLYINTYNIEHIDFESLSIDKQIKIVTELLQRI